MMTAESSKSECSHSTTIGIAHHRPSSLQLTKKDLGHGQIGNELKFILEYFGCTTNKVFSRENTAHFPLNPMNYRLEIEHGRVFWVGQGSPWLTTIDLGASGKSDVFDNGNTTINAYVTCIKKAVGEYNMVGIIPKIPQINH